MVLLNQFSEFFHVTLSPIIAKLGVYTPYGPLYCLILAPIKQIHLQSANTIHIALQKLQSRFPFDDLEKILENADHRKKR